MAFGMEALRAHGSAIREMSEKSSRPSSHSVDRAAMTGSVRTTLSDATRRSPARAAFRPHPRPEAAEHVVEAAA